MIKMGHRRGSKPSFIVLTSIIVCAILTFLLGSAGSEDSVTAFCAAPGEAVKMEMTLHPDSSIKILVSPAMFYWSLDPRSGENSNEVDLAVCSPRKWQIWVKDENPITCGYMTEYDTLTDAYVGQNPKKLTNPICISAITEGIQREVDCSHPEGELIATGCDTYGEPNNEKEIATIFKQLVTWDDPVLSDDHEYRIAVTFFVSPTY